MADILDGIELVSIGVSSSKGGHPMQVHLGRRGRGGHTSQFLVAVGLKVKGVDDARWECCLAATLLSGHLSGAVRTFLDLATCRLLAFPHSRRSTSISSCLLNVSHTDRLSVLVLLCAAGCREGLGLSTQRVFELVKVRLGC